jgi:hypothetical protein
MKQIADITLIENSSAGNPSKTFAAQTIDIRRVADTIHPSADGIISSAKHPSTVIWFGGNVGDFDHITNVRIVSVDGTVLIDAEILRTFEQPHSITGGVQFQVLI